MACDYKESCSKVYILLCLALWAFPLLLALYPMHSTPETAFANVPMHARDTRIHSPNRCNCIERLAETPQYRNQNTVDVYWNTSTSHCDLTKSEMSRAQAPISSRPFARMGTVENALKHLIDSFQTWMLMICCMTFIFDDLIPALISKFAVNHKDKVCGTVRNRTTIVASPFFRICQIIVLVIAFVCAVKQGLPIWTLPVIDRAPKPRKRRWEPICSQGFHAQGVFLKSSRPQQVIRTRATIGDGNCFWRAVASNLPIKWHTLKRCVLRSALLDPDKLDTKEIRMLLKKNQWANSVAIQLTAKFLDCNLAIWHKGGIGFFSSPNRNANTIFLSLSNHHFESLPAKTGIKLLASCDPYSPMPIQALSYCNQTDYPEATTIPCRTLKISRSGYFERFTFAPPNSFASHKNIGLGLNPRETTQQNHLDCPLRSNPVNHPRKSNIQKTGYPPRTSWPAWYLLAMFGLHCLGTQFEHCRRSLTLDHQLFNISAHTSNEEFQKENFRQNEHFTHTSPHLSVSQISNNTAASCKHCIGADVSPDKSLLSANSCSQDVSAVQLCHDLDAFKASIQQYRDHTLGIHPFRNSYFLGGYGPSNRVKDCAMVISRAEVELEKRIRSLRSELDTDDSMTSMHERQQLNNRYQTVMRALLSKRIARSRSRSPIQRRTRRELNRLMRGSGSGLRATPHAALEQHAGINEGGHVDAGSGNVRAGEARPMQPSEPMQPPPWCRQFYIETWGSSPQRPMTSSAFGGLAQARIDIRLHEHNDPGRDPYLHKHVGLHCTTLLRHAQHIEIQKALACTLRLANTVQSVCISICCTQGRHRSVAFSECLRTLVEMQQNHCKVQLNHRAAMHNWWRLCRPNECEECSLHCSDTPDGQAFRDELQQTLSVCFTLDVNEHPYVRSQLAPAYTDCIAAPICSRACIIHTAAAHADEVQDDDLTDNRDALEHPVSSASTANMEGSKKAPSFFLSCPNKLRVSPFLNDTCKEFRIPSGATRRGNGIKVFSFPFARLSVVLPSWYLVGGFLPITCGRYNITSNWDALEHPTCITTEASTMQSREALFPSLPCPHKMFHTCSPSKHSKEAKVLAGAHCHLQSNVSLVNLPGQLYQTYRLWSFNGEDPLLGFCFPDTSSQPSLNLLGKDDEIRLQIPFFKKLRCLLDQYGFGHFNLKYPHKSNVPLLDDRHFIPKINWECSPLPTFPSRHNSGRGDEECNAHNAIPCNCGGIPIPRFKGLPKNPYGVHLSEGCIGAAHTSEGDHCKSPRNGLPQSPFGFFGSLFSRLFLFPNRSLNLGCDSKCCSSVEKTNTMSGSRTKHAHWCCGVNTCLKVEHGPQLCCTSPLTCTCSKEYTCNSHDHDAITLAAVHENLYYRSPHPWVQLEGGFLTDNIVQRSVPLPAYSVPPCLRARSIIMPASPAELLLERQMIRLRSDLQHGPVQEDAQLIADMERQYRDLQEDLDNRRADRSRSREPIRRRTQYELNRLMRGQAPKAAAAKPAVAKPKGAVNRPVTPPKSPPPVRPKTPPKSPPNAPPLTVYSASVNPVPRPSAPLTPKQPSYPPPKVASDLQTLPKASAKTAGVPKPPSSPPPTSAKTAWVPKPPPTPPTPTPSSAASSPTRSITAKLVVSKARPKAKPSAPSAAAASSTTSAEVPSSSKAPALPLHQASAPNVGPPPAGKKIYIESYGLRPDNPMAPSQSHPDVQLDVYVDLRRLHNPQQNRSLRSHTGLHKDTILEIARHHEIPRVLALILQQCNAYDCIHVHIACTQGRHRSVGFSGILRQAVLSQMPQALVFVAHRAAQNNWGPLCGLLRCEACSVFRSLSPEGQALRNKVATAISSCFTLAVNSHSYVQLVPRYMLACPLCVPNLACLRLFVQPAQDRQYNPPLSGGALERHRSRGTATPYNAKPPCLVWFWVLFKTSTSPFRSWPHYSLLACKDQICRGRCHTAPQPIGLADIDPGNASYVPSHFPKPFGNGIRFDFLESNLGFQTSKIDAMQDPFISDRLHFIGGGDEEEQHLVPFWDACNFDSPQSHNYKSPSSSQPMSIPHPANTPPFWEALDVDEIPTCDNSTSVNQFNHPEDLDDHISAAQDDTFVYDGYSDLLQENYSPCPSTAIDSPTSSESLTQPYHYDDRTCPNSPSFEHHYSCTPLPPKGIKRKFAGSSPPNPPHHHHQDDDLQTKDHVRHDHNDDDHFTDVDETSLRRHCNHDEERSPSITSSYIGSVQNFLVQQGPYPGWEYDEAFVQVHPGQLQLPLIFIPSSPEPPSSELSPSNTSSIERAGHDHWDAWSQDSDGHLHARQPDATNSASSRLPSQCHTPPEFDPWDQVPTQDFLDIMGEHDENPSEISSHPSLNALLWENKPDSPMQGGAKHKSEAPANVCTEADISRQVQRIKDLSHGLVSKQLRLLLKGDSKFYKKIVRTTNEEHLLSCILAEAKRIGLNPAANTPETAAVVQPGRGKGLSHQESPKGKDNGNKPKGESKGKSSYDPRQQKGHEKGKGKDEPRNKGTSKGQDGKNKGKGKGTSGSSNPANRSTFSIVPDGWNVLPADEFNGTNGGIFAIENEDDARKLAESAANASFPVAILSPKPLGVGIGAPRPLDVEFFESKNGMQQIVTLHTYLHQLTQHEAKYAKNARVVQINRPAEARTQIVYLKYTDQGASTQMRIDLQDKRSHQHKTWIQSIINAPNPIQLQDLWHIQDAGIANGIRYYTASARVPSEQVPTALTISQPGRIQTNIPAHIRQEIQHIWLKSPAGALSDEEVLEVMQKCSVPHLGAFNLRGTWALRFHISKIDEAKKLLGRDKAPAYFIHGASHDMNSNDVQETCRQINWSVSVGSDDFRVRNGNPVWLVRANQPPPIFGFPLNFGYERLRIQIYAAARATVPAAPPKIEAAHPPSFSSWQAQAKKAPNDRPTKPTYKDIVQQAGPPVKKTKVMVPGATTVQANPRVNSFNAPAPSSGPCFPLASVQHQPQKASTEGPGKREEQLEQQLLLLQQQNQAQFLQIQALMEQIANLTTQLQGLAAMQTSVPREEDESDDSLMEGGNLPQESS